MVRVNRNELGKTNLDALLLEFDIFLGKQSSKSTSVLLNELLGREERVTLAKRLATIILLSEGTSQYKVAQVLKLSQTTTGRISAQIQKGSYSGILILLKKNKRDYLSVLEKIDTVLHLDGLLPHRVGLDRYPKH